MPYTFKEQNKIKLPFDILDDKFISNGHVEIADKKITVFVGGDVLCSYLIDDAGSLKVSADVGCGRLCADIKGVNTLIVRFSKKYLKAYSSYINHKKETDLNFDFAHKTDKVTTLKRCFNLCKPYILKLIIAGSIMIVAALCKIGYQHFQKLLIDDYLAPVSGAFGDALPIILCMLLFTVISIAATIIKNILCTSLGASMSNSLRQKVFNKTQDLSVNYIYKTSVGSLINRVSEDTRFIREFMEHAFGQITSSLFTTLSAFITMCIIDFKLALITVSFAPVSILLLRPFHKKMGKMFRAQSRKSDSVKSKLQDIISGIKVVKSFGKEEKEIKSFESLSDEYANIQSYNETFWAVFFPILSLMMGIGINVVYYLGGFSVINGQMSAGTLVEFIALTTMLYTPMRWLARLPRLIVRMTTSVNRIYELLDEESEIVYKTGGIEKEINGDIEFKNVCFYYETENDVLKDISFKIKKGEMVGLVGESGVGKTTVTNLITRLYDAISGEVLIDGVNIQDYSKDCLHSQIGAVLQENFLFAGSVLDNLKFAKQDASYTEIISACKAAHAHDFICSLPDGYDTYIGEHGYNLSGGERQRIAIARALLCNPKILILDEATSSLDTKNEIYVQKALKNLCKQRTTIAIAHRLSTLRNADKIIVLDKGRISEIGSHTELMKNKGIYYSLIKAQSKLHKAKLGN